MLFACHDLMFVVEFYFIIWALYGQSAMMVILYAPNLNNKQNINKEASEIERQKLSLIDCKKVNT